MSIEHTGEKRERKRLNDRWNKVVGGGQLAQLLNATPPHTRIRK